MTPREKAAACFAKAHSTTSEHERDNAITLGTRIAQAAGISLDDFDIPGRELSRPRMHRLTREEAEALFAAQMEAMIRNAPPPVFRRQPRYCPHGSDMALFGDSCILCERDRRNPAGSGRQCPGGCGKTILFGDSCTECDRAGRV